ncbi:MAG: LLM class flavin-dependent oxidoreductase, partial [Gammaproteobacteria bacterium]
MTDVAGIPEEEVMAVREAAARGDFAAGAKRVSDLAVAKCSVAGTPDEVIPQIEAMAEAGVSHVAFGHCLGPDFDAALDLLGREVLPHFRN